MPLIAGGPQVVAGTGDPIDLVTLQYATAATASAGLSPAEVAQLPNQITSVSRLFSKTLNRTFQRQIYDGLYTASQPGNSILARNFPVNRILKLATNATTVLSVCNTQTSVNQDATIELATEGSFTLPDLPPRVTGLRLERESSGVLSSSFLDFGLYVTVQALADAVNALGNGWTATVATSYGQWGTSHFRAVQGAIPALGRDSPATLKIHVDRVPFTLEPEEGEIAFVDEGTDAFNSIRFGPYLSTSYGDLDVGGERNGLRLIYDAGFDVIPQDVQQAAIEQILFQFATLKNDQSLKSERIGGYSYELNTEQSEMPRSVMGKIYKYMNRRA